MRPEASELLNSKEHPMSATLQQRQWLCQQCMRALQRVSTVKPGAGHGRSHVRKRFRSDDASSERQAVPLSGYYAELLQHPTSRTMPPTRAAPTQLPPSEQPMTQKEQTLARARIVFGSRLAGPAERAAELRKASTMVAGVLVPPKPEEPDNCCMSGCVNCVWDLYREELEEWAAKGAEARAKLLAQSQSGGTGSRVNKAPVGVDTTAMSMDDDGGGSETNWPGPSKPDANVDGILQGIPVGIREFIRTEKALRQRHKLEGEVSAV